MKSFLPFLDENIAVIKLQLNSIDFIFLENNRKRLFKEVLCKNIYMLIKDIPNFTLIKSFNPIIHDRFHLYRSEKKLNIIPKGCREQKTKSGYISYYNINNYEFIPFDEINNLPYPELIRFFPSEYFDENLPYNELSSSDKIKLIYLFSKTRIYTNEFNIKIKSSKRIEAVLNRMINYLVSLKKNILKQEFEENLESFYFELAKIIFEIVVFITADSIKSSCSLSLSSEESEI